jgi:hypothetical protein
MALTKTDICNMALSKIGDERSQIADFDTATGKIKDQLVLHYEQTLKEVIRSHSWNCCKARVKLVASGSDPLFGFEYEFDLPTDCIRPLYLTPTNESERYLRPMIDWSVEKRLVLANFSDVWLLYIKQPDPGDMDALFAQAFYTLLASKLAVPIKGDRKIEQLLLQEYLNGVMPEARRVNSFEGRESPVVDSEVLEATYTSPSNLGSSWPPFSQASYGSFPWS